MISEQLTISISTRNPLYYHKNILLTFSLKIRLYIFAIKV